MITALAPIPPHSPAAQALFRQHGAPDKGCVTQAELASALVRISTLGASLASGNAHDDAQAAFQRIDVNHDGRVTSAEFLQGVSLQRLAAPAAAAAHAAPPGQGLTRYAEVLSLARAADPGWH